MNPDTLMQGFYGLSTAAAIYWLVQHARKVGLIHDPRVSFLVPGAAWAVLVLLWVFSPAALMPVMVGMAGWVTTLLFKAGAKDNERNPS